MSADSSATPPSSSETQPGFSQDPNRFPPQVKYIVGNEACERFSYYGMKGLLAGYITTVLLKGHPDAGNISTQIIHYFGAANYIMPLIGGFVADRFWGRYHTILWISLFYCLGHLALAVTEGSMWGLLVGLALIAFGSGGIKPCVSAFVGDQFGPNQRHLLNKVYSLFYFSINFGSFFAFIIIPAIKDKAGYSWAFGIPGLFMGAATLIFFLGRKHYVRVPPARETKSVGFLPVFGAALSNLGTAAPGEGFWAAARKKFSDKEVNAASAVLSIIILFLPVIFFWSLFDQTFSTWLIQGEKMRAEVVNLFGYTWKIGPETMLAANPVFVMLFLPVLTLWVYPALGKWARPLVRMSVGMVLAGLSFVIVGVFESMLNRGVELSIAWQILPYAILTISEVFVSTTGLEFAFREAPAQMKSTITSFWNLTVALGNVFVAVFASLSERVGATGPALFHFYAGLMFVVALIFVALAVRYRSREDEFAAEQARLAEFSDGDEPRP